MLVEDKRHERLKWFLHCVESASSKGGLLKAFVDLLRKYFLDIQGMQNDIHTLPFQNVSFSKD